MPEVITIGETMAAFVPKTAGYLRYIHDYELRVAGAESNLAIGIAKLGHSVGWISCLGQDELGIYVRNTIRSEGVDTSCVSWDSEHRTGLMLKQIRNSTETSVFYYRANSAASNMRPDALKKEYFRESRILHMTGITPILSDSCLETAEAAIALAKAQGLLVSFDPNIRRKLWGTCDYSSMLRSMVMSAQIVLLGRDEAELLFGTGEPQRLENILFSGGNTMYMAIKNGARGAFVGDGNSLIEIPPYPCHCVDPIGAGDAFDAAFLCGLLENCGITDCGRMGGVAGAFATETYGDTEGYPTREQMMSVLIGREQIYR